MNRPLMQRRIEQLEELLRANGNDEKVLKQLEYELQFRQVPRARALLSRVQAERARESRPASVTAPINAPTQGDLLAGNAQSGTPMPTSTEWKPRVPVVTAPDISHSSPSSSPQKITPSAASISMAEAYKVLGVSPSASWDAVELARRRIVQLAHPQRLASIAADKRAAVKAEARRANEAYAAIHQARAE